MPQKQDKITPDKIIQTTGLFVIDNEELLDKCKIKDKKTIAKINEILETYGTEFKDIQFKHKTKLDDILNTPLPEAGKEVTDEMKQKYRSMGQNIEVIKGDAAAMHKRLDKAMKIALDNKSRKRWESYYKRICKNVHFDPNIPIIQETEKKAPSSKPRRKAVGPPME